MEPEEAFGTTVEFKKVKNASKEFLEFPIFV
jgi:hypothetical protein